MRKTHNAPNTREQGKKGMEGEVERDEGRDGGRRGKEGRDRKKGGEEGREVGEGRGSRTGAVASPPARWSPAPSAVRVIIIIIIIIFFNDKLTIATHYKIKDKYNINNVNLTSYRTSKSTRRHFAFGAICVCGS